MSPAWLAIVLVVLVLALIPVGLKWLQRYVGTKGLGSTSTTRIVSAVGVGPNQRVVTVEIGPEGDRTWLTLGVTTHSITCLHVTPVSGSLGRNDAAKANSVEVLS
jgi:flagellar protein FliO/FliZ